MVLSGSEALLARVRDLRGYEDQDDDRLRFNYKMTDLQAALGWVQLKRLGSFLAQRRAIARRYSEALASRGVDVPQENALEQPIYYRYVLGMRQGVEAFLAACLQKGVCCRRPVYRPLHHYLPVPALPHSEEAWRRNASLPIYPSLAEAEVDRVIEVVKEVIGN